MTNETERTEAPLAAELADEAERMRRRHLHAARPRGPLTMDDAQRLAERMTGKDTGR